MTLWLDSVYFSHEVAVADLQDDCLLGADILLGLKDGPFNLLLSENLLVLNKVAIPCIQVGAPVVV